MRKNCERNFHCSSSHKRDQRAKPLRPRPNEGKFQGQKGMVDLIMLAQLDQLGH